MMPHTKVYFKHFNIQFNESGWHDPISCEICGSRAVDIHHINGRLGDANVIENLIALCRKCHMDAHSNELTKGDLHIAHSAKLGISNLTTTKFFKS